MVDVITLLTFAIVLTAVKEIIKYGEPYRTDEGLVPAEERKEVYHLENYNNDTFRMSIME